jgi:hypothetical protein
MKALLLILVLSIAVACNDDNNKNVAFEEGSAASTAVAPNDDNENIVVEEGLPAEENDIFVWDESTYDGTALVVEEFIAPIWFDRQPQDYDGDPLTSPYICSFAASTNALIWSDLAEDVSATFEIFQAELYYGLYPYQVLAHYFEKYLDLDDSRIFLYNRDIDFIDIMMSSLEEGHAVILPIRREKEYGLSSQGHVINVYGYQILDDGTYNLWVCDSGDGENRAFLANVSWSETDGRWYMSGYYAGNWYIHSIIYIS